MLSIDAENPGLIYAGKMARIMTYGPDKFASWLGCLKCDTLQKIPTQQVKKVKWVPYGT